MTNGTKFLQSELQSFPSSSSPVAIWVVKQSGNGTDTTLHQLIGEVLGGVGNQPQPAPPMNKLLAIIGKKKLKITINKSSSIKYWVSPIGTTGAVALQYKSDSSWCDAIEFWAGKFSSKISMIFEELSQNVTHDLIAEHHRRQQKELFDPKNYESTGKTRIPVYLPRRRELPDPEFVDGAPGIVGVSREICEACSTAISIATSDVNVLLNGDSGTGKELFAKLIHQRSLRSQQIMVGVNCASLPESLFESEIFGHKSGSFTGAIGDKTGLLESANGGIFFLDEIGDMPVNMQIKLLRVIQEKKLRRIGELQDREIDVRIISASHKNLQEEIIQSKFRLDLYYRLMVVQVSIPPLRRRPEDIIYLLSYFLQQNRGQQHRTEIEEEALYALQSYQWPGNVRELENETRRWCALNRDSRCIKLGQLSLEVKKAAGREVEAHDLVSLRPLTEATELLERYLIRKAIAASCGSKTIAAKQLGMSRQGLYKKIRRFDMSDLLQTS
ncbi:sigma 54-interacting transcriptional regulator [bacterium]|nr:sigma 54-interacting transcriptional regulator [bacterium]